MLLSMTKFGARRLFRQVERKPRHNQILLIIGDAQGLCAPVLVMVEFINSIFDCFNVHTRSNPLIKMGT